MRYNKDILVEKDPNSIKAILEYRYYDPERVAEAKKRTMLHQEEQFNDNMNYTSEKKMNYRLGKTSAFWKTPSDRWESKYMQKMSNSKEFEDKWFDMDYKYTSQRVEACNPTVEKPLQRSKSAKFELWQDPQYSVQDLYRSNSHAVDLNITNS